MDPFFSELFSALRWDALAVLLTIVLVAGILGAGAAMILIRRRAARRIEHSIHQIFPPKDQP